MPTEQTAETAKATAATLITRLLDTAGETQAGVDRLQALLEPQDGSDQISEIVELLISVAEAQIRLEGKMDILLSSLRPRHTDGG